MEILNFITNFIRIDIFLSFGFYSIIYFILRTFLKDKVFILDFDKSATELIIYLGFVWLVLWLIGTWIYYLGLENKIEQIKYYELLTGKYAYAIWIQPIFWFLLTQVYRIKFIKKYLIFRIIISLFFIVTFERFVILITLFHRDYLPSNWTLDNKYGIDTNNLILGLLGKILVIIMIISLYHFGIKKIKTLFS
ncbi:hypothetical protein [uncultured Algibacter sp.]|uniref:hypothetical protein n=1 Tax=uncultured Algibacter sp. TaxID=298659 RepID=UPI0032171211